MCILSAWNHLHHHIINLQSFNHVTIVTVTSAPVLSLDSTFGYWSDYVSLHMLYFLSWNNTLHIRQNRKARLWLEGTISNNKCNDQVSKRQREKINCSFLHSHSFFPTYFIYKPLAFFVNREQRWALCERGKKHHSKPSSINNCTHLKVNHFIP